MYIKRHQYAAKFALSIFVFSSMATADIIEYDLISTSYLDSRYSSSGTITADGTAFSTSNLGIFTDWDFVINTVGDVDGIFTQRFTPANSSIQANGITGFANSTDLVLDNSNGEVAGSITFTQGDVEFSIFSPRTNRFPPPFAPVRRPGFMSILDTSELGGQEIFTSPLGETNQFKFGINGRPPAIPEPSAVPIFILAVFAFAMTKYFRRS